MKNNTFMGPCANVLFHIINLQIAIFTVKYTELLLSRSRSVILVAKYTNLVLLKGWAETFISLDEGLV